MLASTVSPVRKPPSCAGAILAWQGGASGATTDRRGLTGLSGGDGHQQKSSWVMWAKLPGLRGRRSCTGAATDYPDCRIRLVDYRRRILLRRDRYPDASGTAWTAGFEAHRSHAYHGCPDAGAVMAAHRAAGERGGCFLCGVGDVLSAVGWVAGRRSATLPCQFSRSVPDTIHECAAESALNIRASRSVPDTPRGSLGVCEHSQCNAHKLLRQFRPMRAPINHVGVNCHPSKKNRVLDKGQRASVSLVSPELVEQSQE